MHSFAITLSLICIVFFVARVQLRLYHDSPNPTWHDSSDASEKATHLFIEPGLSFGHTGEPILTRSLVD